MDGSVSAEPGALGEISQGRTEEQEGGVEARRPPPPHDPAERVVVARLGAWEVRLFTGRKLEYFVPRGLWHAQLWHPGERVSVLTPSRLTCGLYEAYPVEGWKARARRYEELVARVVATEVPLAGEVARLERSLVDGFVATRAGRPS